LATGNEGRKPYGDLFLNDKTKTLLSGEYNNRLLGTKNNSGAIYVIKIKGKS